ncbi:MAG TPA: 3-oxoacyl-ACP reductase FabG [Aggregatilinea sp.]|uniref:3-oxoacyl-ACP reductase FabG n=1 Tax=Aggregatilinea sp. TaxID=2806333 RepID=UPI002C3760F4|nr:3-oxoacyl-ACP reductase FabG [Aggregatilinea sp.]HML22951.1 3-oxoacyl-ACP reductase FabG [Aggregatilinea sp.]
MADMLKGRVALVTGGAQGIGKAIALRFAREGAKVVVIDVTQDKADATVEEIKAAGGEAMAAICNVTNREQVAELVAKVIEVYGQIDILCNNAGILRDARLVKMTEEQFDSVIDVNLKGVFNMTQAVAPHMVERGYGRIISTSSIVGLYGNFGQTNYVATKAAVIGMTRVWARELGPKGITANAVAPGFIATDMVKAMPEKVLEMFNERTPVHRLGEPEDIAYGYLMLASEEASFINGTVLSVDGGLVM